MTIIINSIALALLAYVIFAFVQAELNPFVWSWEIRSHMTFVWFLLEFLYVSYLFIGGKIKELGE